MSLGPLERYSGGGGPPHRLDGRPTRTPTLASVCWAVATPVGWWRPRPPRPWGLPSGLIGALLIGALERGERVHAAMIARGWDGTIRTLDGTEARSPGSTEA